MKFFQRIRAVFSNSYFEEYVKQWVGGGDMPPDTYGQISQDLALKYSAFFACNRVLAETFASVSIHEYKRDTATGDREATDETGLFPILHTAPNDETSAYNFQECQMYQTNLGGNFVAERLVDGRRLAGLSQLEWQDVTIFRDQNDRRIKYRAARAIMLGHGYEKFGQEFFKNGAVPSVVFEIPGFLKDEAYDRLKKEIKTNYTGLKNAGTPMLLEDGLKASPLTIKPIDAELLSSRKFQIEDICRFFRVQPHLVQHLEKSTNNNIEQQSLEFVMYTMLPHFRRAEQNINSQLLTPRQRAEGYYMEYNISTLLRGDQKTMAESFAKGRCDVCLI